MTASVKVFLPPAGKVILALIGEEETPIDLTSVADIIATLGAEKRLEANHESVGTTNFATIDVPSGVRFHVEGKRVTTVEGLRLLSNGVRFALMDMTSSVAKPPGAREHVSACSFEEQNCC